MPEEVKEPKRYGAGKGSVNIDLDHADIKGKSASELEKLDIFSHYSPAEQKNLYAELAKDAAQTSKDVSPEHPIGNATQVNSPSAALKASPSVEVKAITEK